MSQVKNASGQTLDSLHLHHAPPPFANSNMSFFERIENRAKAINSLLCIGLDPHSSELNCPQSATEEDRAEAAYHFCVRIIDATHPHAVCYKPNAAFFEAIGHKYGMSTLRRVIDHIIPHDVPVLLDVKRGDIGTTAEAYADACYDKNGGCGADGVTLSPLMGWDSIKPFITGKLEIEKEKFFVHSTTISISLVDDYRHIFATLDLSLAAQ